MAHPFHEHKDHKVQKSRVSHIAHGYAHGGGVHRHDAEDIARRLAADLPLPDGYKCEYAVNTDNILIYNPSFGFCITNRYCADHTYPEIRAAAAEILVHLMKEMAGIDRFQPTEELLNPTRDTRFDGGL